MSASIHRTTITASLLAALLSSTALAQAPGAEPGYGTVRFDGDSGPISAAVRAGGALSADRASSGCAGYITDGPTLVVDHAGGMEALYLSAASDVDTTLVVRDPGGRWICDDDGGAGGFNPGVRIGGAPAGRYEIWVGTFSAGVGYPVALVHASETGFSDANPYARTLNEGGEPQIRMNLAAGFDEDPRRAVVRAGGDVDLGNSGTGCFGYVAEAPSAALTYEAGALGLYLAALSDERDLVLAVQTPSGGWVCDDDSAGDLNPGIHLTEPESGEYRIWAGTLGDAAPVNAELTVSEIGFAGVDYRLDLAAPALFGTESLQAGFSPDPASFPVEAGGPLDAYRAIDESEVVNGWCAGSITRAPSFELMLDGANEAPLHVSASSDGDATLAVNAPDGSWWCDDDSGAGLNPALVVEPAQAGVYDIYVGGFSGDERFDAQLHVSQTGPGPDGIIPSVDLTLPALFGEIALAPGFAPQPYALRVDAGGPLQASEAGVEAPADGWCAGMITTAPTVELDWSGQGGPLVLDALTVEGDTTLVVNLPDGSWACDDDGGEGLNARLVLSGAPGGVYDIYVGAFGAGQIEAELQISEALPEPSGG
ncbi:MAG: hypothetical protein AAFX09_06010 [Pseudomonadota bacterium]